MSFLYPHILWFLFLPALLAGLVALARRKTGNGWLKLVSAEHTDELVTRRPAWRSIIPAALCILALACTIAALARPINGFREAGGLSTGRNLLIALDISRSMETQDVKPSRLEEARAAAYELIDSLPSDKIGLIVFSGDADLVVPLTYDHTALRDALEQVNRNWAGTGGTNFGLVLKRAMQDLKRSAPDGTNALVLLSDGEDTVGSSLDIAEEARKDKLLVITVGVGTAAGGPIPDPKGQNGLWQDADGKHVISKLDADSLRKFSEATGGDFAVLDSNTDLAAFTKNAVRKIDKHEENVSTNKVPNDLFAWFAWVALALLAAAIVIATEWRLPRRGAAAVALLLILTPAAQAAPSGQSVVQYTKGLMQEGKDNANAKEAFSEALLDSDPQMQAAAFYQIGNVGANATIDKLRRLYGEGEQEQAEQVSTDPEEEDGAAAPQGPKQPSIEDLEKVVEELKKDLLPYENALKIQPALKPAESNIAKIKQLIKDLEEEIERLKQQQQQQQQNQDQNQDQQQQQNQDQQKQN
ncbi:MAG: VWA domain-containing protein, partial [Akkermansia sp.]|nr:VWA domain-containing protein [Akkermansia sp.]